MVSPVLKQGAVSVDAYFPAGSWFSLFNYSNFLSVTNGHYLTLDAPLDHINVHVREGNVLAMQGEAPTTRAARETPFRLLVALSSNENSTGEVFLDDGEGVEMGSDGGRWTLVQYNGYILGSTAALESRVDNAEYALSQKWRLDQVTVLGSNHSVGLVSYELMINTGGNWIKKSAGKSSFDNGGQFAVVEICGISILMGEEFRLKLNLSM